MFQPSSTSAPTSQTMSRSDYRHASDMAQYHVERRQFEQSPYRVTCSQLGTAAMSTSVLGCCVAAPIMGAKLSCIWPPIVTIVTSCLCFFAGGLAFDEAGEPAEPIHPDVAARQLRECGGG